MEKCFYVYKIICLCGEWKDRYYIGSHYGYTDDKYTGSGKNIKEYFKLFGKNGTYKKEILEMLDNEIYIKDKEKEFIRKNIDNDLCLNMVVRSGKSTVGKSSGMKGKKMSDETRQKMSESQKGRKFSEEHIQNMSKALKGKKCTDETRRKISEANKGKKMSDEARRKISEGNKGKKNYLGKHHSEETKDKIRNANKGKKMSDETRQKMSEAKKLYYQKKAAQNAA